MTHRIKGGAHGGAPLLWLYRAAWEPALWIARLGAALEGIARSPSTPLRDRSRWGIPERLGKGWAPPEGKAGLPVIWLHAASLGECKGLWAFAQTLRDRPARFLLTANTAAGREFLRGQIARDANRERWTARLAPLDHPRVVARFLRSFGVRALVLFEVELWPHFIRESRRAGVPVFWVSARLTDRARRRYAGRALFEGALRRVLRDVAWAQAQTEGEAEALRRLGCDRAEAGGDLRGLHYLAGAETGEGRNTVPWDERNGVAFVSMHAEELPVLVPLLAAAGGASPLFVFPRKMGELPAFRKALEPLGFALQSERPAAARAIVDAFGRVAETLARCRGAVIGGGFAPRGGHNLWEPLRTGTRLAAGPHLGNQEYLARKLADAGLLRVLRPGTADGNRAAILRALSDAGDDPAPLYEAFIRAEDLALRRAAARAGTVIAAALDGTDGLPPADFR